MLGVGLAASTVLSDEHSPDITAMVAHAPECPEVPRPVFFLQQPLSARGTHRDNNRLHLTGHGCGFVSILFHNQSSLVVSPGR
jgi:hypothetical protein